MKDHNISQVEQDDIQAEQVKAYFVDGNVLNLAGAAVFSLLVFVVHDATPWWTWLPFLLSIYLIGAYRAYLFWRYHRAPESRTSRQWRQVQTLSGAALGVCWGAANTAMLANLPIDFQLFVLTISAVVAATSSSEGFSLKGPPRSFILLSTTPITLWLLFAGDRLHGVLALMLIVFIPITLAIIEKKNGIFKEAQHYRFQNEHLAKQLLAQQKVVEQASVAKSKFLAAASHDLRQPLSALVLFLDQLHFENLSTKGGIILDRAQQASQSLQNLLECLLDISKFDGQAVKPNIKAFPVQRILDEMNKEFEQLARHKGVRLTFSPSSVFVNSDQALIEQILRNLISNAIRYTSSGRVLVGCRRRSGMLAIEVHDTGIGIAADHLPKIFDEFYQVGNRERERERGLGLGLSIVDRVVRLLGHPITVKSELGKGSSFIITLPLAAEDESNKESAPTIQAEDLTLSGLRFAIIENECSIREGMLELLQSWGCRVVVAESATSLLAELERPGEPVTIDMVISDFGLRGRANGIATIAMIRQQWGNDIPALLFTGDISKATFQAAREAGVAILYKPAKPEKLRWAIGAELHKRNEVLRR